MTINLERFIIIDGNAILHRAFHAMPPLTTSSGKLINAVYGFASILLKLRDGFKPEYFAVTFDLPKPTFRKKMFTGYQIKRPKMDEGLSSQVELVKELVRVLGIPIYEMEGFEADDVIGTLVCQSRAQSSKFKVQNQVQNFKSESPEVIIVTGDKDILQLVDENTKVYMPTKGITEAILYDKDKVKEKFGFLPELIPDYKGLVGDSSDNYPGVGGIGPKTAVDLLTKFGSFEKVYNNINNVSEGVKEKLTRGKEMGELSHRLAKIVKDVPVELDLDKCKIDTFDKPEVKDFFEKMEFKSLLKRLSQQPSANKQQKDTEKKEENQMKMF